MRKIRDVLACAFDKELSEREISRCTNVGRRTIAEYKRRFACAGLSWPLPSTMDDVALERALYPHPGNPTRRTAADIEFAVIHMELKKKGATLAVLHEEWLQTVPEEAYLSYSQFCRLYNEYRKSLRLSLRQNHVHGEAAFVDYAGPTVAITDPKTGTIRHAQIFIGVLGGSNLTYCEATWSQTSQDWIESHCRMLEFFCGVPRVIVHDNLKAATTKADRYAPIINESYEAFCRHYGTHAFAARAYRPRDKAKAEAGVLLVERWILFRIRGRRFFSLAELNSAIREHLHTLNMKPFQKLPGSRFGNWMTSEKAALHPLPVERYQFAEWGKVRAGMDYHVVVDRHAYSVPYLLRGQQLEYRLTSTSLALILKGKSIAAHVRSYEAGGKTTHPSHQAPEHQAFDNWSEEEALEWARAVGSHVETVLRAQLKNVNNRLFGYRMTQAMKKLHRDYGKTRLEEACAFAHQHNLMHSRRLRSILSGNIDRLFAQSESGDIEEQLSALDIPDHENLRGADYYHQFLNEEEKP